MLEKTKQKYYIKIRLWTVSRYPYILPPFFEGFVSISKDLQQFFWKMRYHDLPLKHLNVYEFDKTFNPLWFCILSSLNITPERTQITPDHIRSSPNHALGTYFLYWALPNKFSSLSSSPLKDQYHRNKSFAWCSCLVNMLFHMRFRNTGLPAWVFAFLASKGFLTSVGKHVIFLVRLAACKRSCTDCRQRVSLQNAAACASWYH